MVWAGVYELTFGEWGQEWGCSGLGLSQRLQSLSLHQPHLRSSLSFPGQEFSMKRISCSVQSWVWTRSKTKSWRQTQTWKQENINIYSLNKIWFFTALEFCDKKQKQKLFRVFPDLLRIQFVLFDFMLFIWALHCCSQLFDVDTRWYWSVVCSSSELIFWYLDSVFKWYLQYNQVKAVLMGAQLKLP